MRSLDCLDHKHPSCAGCDCHCHDVAIYNEIADEVVRSIKKHGDQSHVPMGTGPFEQPLDLDRPVSETDTAHNLARAATEATDSRSFESGDRSLTWRDILLEEVFEAFAEDPGPDLRKELIQAGAVIVKMIKALDVQEQ